MATPTIGDAFPADDVLARWVMVLSIARNDLALATERIVRANEADDGTALHWHRLLAGHFFEAGIFLRRTMEIAEVRQFVGELPANRREDYEMLLRTAKRWSKKRLRRGRNRTFHYVDVAEPAIDRRTLFDRLRRQIRRSVGSADIRRALGAVADRPAAIMGSRNTAGGRTVDRFLFADEVAAYFSVEDLGGDPAALRALLERIAAEETKLVQFANAAIDHYQQRRGVRLPTV